jgi:hypothetical protein
MQPLLLWKSNKDYIILVCVCKPSYPAYCHLWSVRRYNIFPYSHTQYDFRKIVIEHKICVLAFSTNLSDIFLIVKRIKRDMIMTVHLSSRKVGTCLGRFERKLRFLDRFSKIILYQIS